MAWLLIAVWWLLKARKTLEHYGRRDSVRSGASIGSSMASSLTSSNQAYVDLLKASFILYDIVLYDKRLPDFLSRECQKVLVELSEGIGETATRVIALGIPEYPAGQPQNTNLQEQDLLEEFPSNNGTPFSSLERTHWVTVKLEDVGEEGEKALFRTFINATSTCKTTRRWTKDAPYMLLLSVKDGETEPRITICNQSGTLCLQRNFEQTDLKDLTLADGSLNGIAEARITEPLSFDFDNRRIEVSFQFYGDYMAFIRIPKEYFEAVSLREPIDRGQSSETVLFKSPVEEYERLKAPEMKSMHPPNIHKSCEVRILERSSSQAWSTTRRLVISMSIAKKNPGCMGFFMPLSRVDVNRDENSCEVQVKWSDTLQPESTQTDGNYHPLYSYVYNANKPNIGIKLRFRTPRLAEKFEKEIFGIGYRSIFSWDQCGSRGIVYDVEGADQKPYKAIALYRGTTPWRGTDLFYLYRDSDYIYEHAHLRVRFPGLTYTNYLSTCVGQISAPQRPVEFSGCEKRVQKNVTVEFDDEQTMRTFMSSLASSYELVYSRSAMSLKTKSRGIFGVTRALSSKGATEVQLWRRGNHFQLASRWADHIQNRWLTMSVPLPELRTSGHSNRVEFPPMPYFRGPVLDFANILARGPAKSPSLSERKGPITITFATSRDQEEFVDILRSSATRPV
ncbi:uncharacterized protein ACLA_073740 [Aspergillus clavatus NRRL 1]|uniref:Uncharacterized protein n=1 Tax=Aspergillus clavatus (strain ATCC 1007 / CBS 513.65 / DSM 816 / NCTC 3887 / NRRL 1 / QM 1276 / 107) TaxID=344612 RepID=A1C7G7_ASPCL|nr:uncharacterized protein ACLA_073740 [Aspergillus clavatus NRRL 1]EAW14338.1 hypothetical protein ACLA_073740 [Aspergillus clavatus NRRL 1]